jgi:hypothetical protein
MSINQLKALTWAASLGVAGFLGWYVYDFFQHRADLSDEVSEEEQYQVLMSVPTPEPPKDDVVDYQAVLATWHHMDWTPEEKVEKGPEGPGEVVEEKPLYKPVAELLEVLMIQVDGGDSERSMAQVRYLDASLESANPSPDQKILKEGQKLTAPYAGIQVERITRNGVVFSFAAAEGDEPRPKELVEPTRLDAGPRIVRTDGKDVVRQTRPTIPQATRERPRSTPQETRLIGNDHYLIGLDDRAEIEKDYTRILAELRFDRHRGPTGKYDGVEVKDVPEGAFAAKYGVKEGQVIKSINGHPITSVSEGIKFAKDNQDKYEVWYIVYDEQGKEKTKVIDTSD